MKVSKTARFYYKGNKRKVNSQAWLKAKAFENAPDLCSKKRVYAINNCICHIFYNNSKNINKNSILNLVVNGNHIKLEGIDRTDIEFYFKDNKNKLSYEINNSKIDINLSYYYRHLSSVWFSKKDNSVINLQSNFNKSKKSQ